MSIVKLETDKATIYVNTDHVALISPHATLLGVTNVTLSNALNFEAKGATDQIAREMGYVNPDRMYFKE